MVTAKWSDGWESEFEGGNGFEICVIGLLEGDGASNWDLKVRQ